MTNERIQEIREEVGCMELGCGCICDEFVSYIVELQLQLRAFDAMMVDRHNLLKNNSKMREALERYSNMQLEVRKGVAVVQHRNGHGEWVNTINIYETETWLLGDAARQALKETK